MIGRRFHREGEFEFDGNYRRAEAASMIIKALAADERAMAYFPLDDHVEVVSEEQTEQLKLDGIE